MFYLKYFIFVIYFISNRYNLKKKHLKNKKSKINLHTFF